MTSHLVLKARELRRHAERIAKHCDCYVIAGPISNPTLERHGLVKAARWHILTHEPPRRAVADLYAGNQSEAARVARLLSALLGDIQLDLLDNRATPADLKAHPRAVVSPGVLANARRGRSGLARAVRKVRRIIAGGSRRIRSATGAKRRAAMASRSARLTARGFHGAALNPPRTPRRARRALASGRPARAQWSARSSIERGAARAARRRTAGSKAFYSRLRSNPKGRKLSVPEQHQLKIARDTLRMNDVFVRIMGGPTKEQAREIIHRLTGRWPNVREVRTLSPLAQRKLLAQEAALSTPVGVVLKRPGIQARARVLLDAWLRGVLQGQSTVSLEEVKHVWIASLMRAATEQRRVKNAAGDRWPIFGGKYLLEEGAPQTLPNLGHVRTFTATGKRGASYGALLYDDGRFHWMNLARGRHFGTVPFDLAQVSPAQFIEGPKANPSRSKGARRGRQLKRRAYTSRRTYRAAVRTWHADDDQRRGALAKFGHYIAGDDLRRARRRRAANPKRRNPRAWTGKVSRAQGDHYVDLFRLNTGIWVLAYEDKDEPRRWMSRRQAEKYLRTHVMNDGNFTIFKPFGGRMFYLAYDGTGFDPDDRADQIPSGANPRRKNPGLIWTGRREGKTYAAWETGTGTWMVEYKPRSISGIGRTPADAATDLMASMKTLGLLGHLDYHLAMETILKDVGLYDARNRPGTRWKNPGRVFGMPIPTAGIASQIRAGDRVTIVDRFGKTRTGRAVMPSAHGGWVLNLGGAHGTPGIADERNIVKVTRPKGNPRAKSPTSFEPRVRFNWGYHEGADAAAQGRSYLYKHFDKSYLAGWQAGHADAKAGAYSGNSSGAWKASRTRNPRGRDPGLDEAARRIRTGLQRRGGVRWSVTRGAGSVYGWIYVKSPRGDLAPDEQRHLAKLLGLDTVHHQGVMVPPLERDDFVARAEGRLQGPRRNPRRRKSAKCFYVHQGETHHNAAGRGFYFNTGGWYRWGAKGEPVGPFETEACAKPTRRNPVGWAGTLADWEARHGTALHRKGELRWTPDFVGTARQELWGLEDYVVSSVSGGTIWLAPRRANPRRRTRSQNGRFSAAEQRAAGVVRKFQDRGAIAVRRRKVKKPKPLGKTAAAIGPLVGVIYESDKFDGRHKVYEHEFGDPKPLLVADPRSEDLHIVRGGSRYRLTPDGIVN